MLKDELVEDVRKVCQEQAARWNFDLKAILADARKRQSELETRIAILRRLLGPAAAIESQGLLAPRAAADSITPVTAAPAPKR